MTAGHTEIWHNPRCSKSRAAVAHLDAAGIDYTVRRYLEDPPTVAELRDLLTRLGAQPWDIARTGEPVAKELGLAGWARTEAERDRWIEALAAHPQLVQRPVVIRADGTAIVARTGEALRALG